jgi:hypothetical protein
MRIRLSALTSAALLLLAFLPALFAQSAQKPAGAINRTSDGKPDFSGFWREGGGRGQGQAEKSVFQGGTATRLPTRAELAKKLPLTPKGKELVDLYTKGDGDWSGETGAFGDSRYHTIPCGPVSPALGGDIEIVQNPKRLLLVYTSGESKWLRAVWIGREHPKDLTDYEPVWMGHSVGKWEGDTLVVDTVRIKTVQGELIDAGNAAPQSPNLHMIERISLGPDGRLRIEKTFQDADIYTRPWTKTVTMAKQSNWDDIAESWEIQDQHTVCEGGRYPSDNDPWFQDKK